MTIAQQLNVKDFPFDIKDKRGNKIYTEWYNGYWTKYEYDANRKLIKCEDSRGYWSKRQYDANGNEIYYENSDRFWFKRQFDANGNKIYFESSNGVIIDNRPKPVEVSMDEIAQKFGVDVSLIKIMK